MYHTFLRIILHADATKSFDHGKTTQDQTTQFKIHLSILNIPYLKIQFLFHISGHKTESDEKRSCIIPYNPILYYSIMQLLLLVISSVIEGEGKQLPFLWPFAE